MVRTRIPPSPTGNLHIGTARSALFNFLFARKHRGEFILRIEDTDKQRSRKEFEENIKEGLEWLGLRWDAFYRQSERMGIYRGYLTKLLEQGRAYYCLHSASETQGKVHFCEYREHTKEAQNKKLKTKNSVIRFKTPRGREVRFEDKVRGNLSFHMDEVGDFSLAKNEETPLYNLAVVIDDYEMEITHVIRGEDHISNTPKQILLQEALGFSSPIYAHLPLILGPDRAKLSKRHGATSIDEYRAQGYLPQAMVNAMAFLGWNPGDAREFFTLEELVQEFSLERVKKGGSIFAIERLNFINRHYLEALSPDEYAKFAAPLARERGIQKEMLKKIAIITKGTPRIVESLDAFDALRRIDGYPPELLVWKKTDQSATLAALKKVKSAIEDISPENYHLDAIKDILLGAMAEEKDRGTYLWPLRVALSGKAASPGPFEIATILGKDETLMRIQKAIGKLS